MTNCCVSVIQPAPVVITATCRDRSVSITAAQQGPPGRDGTGGVLPHPAATALSALRVVSRSGDTYVYADPSDQDLVYAIAGITDRAYNQGEIFTPRRGEELSDSSWNWDLGKPIVLGPNGTLTQADAADWGVHVASPLTPTTIFIGIERPINL